MKLRQLYSGETSMSTASMADIAFLLVIFFMLTTVFTVKKGLDMQLPDQNSRQAVTEDQVIIITLQTDGTIVVGDKTVTLGELTPLLKKETSLKPEKYVIIQAQEDVYYEMVIHVLDELKQSDISNIAIPSRHDFEAWFGET